MDIALFWSLFVVLGITYFAVAMNSSRSVHSEDEFFYANNKLGVWSTALSMAAVHIGGGMVLGTAFEAFRFGFRGILYNLGICAGFFVLAFGVAGRLRKIGIKTIAELFQQRYGSMVLRRIASILSIVTLGGILTGQIIASRKLLLAVVGQYHWLLILFWLLVIVYTMFGGLRAVVATEAFQLIIVISVISGMVLFYDGLQGLSFSALKQQSQGLFDIPLEQRYLSLFLLPFLYAFLAQDLGQRYFSTKSPWVASLSSFIAGVIVLGFSLVPVIVGMGAHDQGLVANSGIEVFLGMFKTNTLPFFYYLLVCAIIAAISSTADGILCAVGSNVVEDFSLVANAKSSERYVGVLISRIVILVVGLISLLIGYVVDDILGVLSLSYELSVSCLLIPILFALFFKKLPFLAAALAMAMGVLGILVFRFYPFIIPRELLSLLLSLLGFLMGLIYSSVKTSAKVGS